MHDYYSQLEPSAIDRYIENANIHIPLIKVPTKSIENLDNLGLPRVTNFILPPMVELNEDALNRAICNFENSENYLEERRDDYRNYNDMIDLRKSLIDTPLPNFIPQYYRESSTGRLFPSNSSSHPSIIPMSKELKALIFSGMNYYIYDIENAHFSIFSGLCKRYGLECPSVNYYLAHKSQCRNE
jgi:hypothetical protein